MLPFYFYLYKILSLYVAKININLKQSFEKYNSFNKSYLQYIFIDIESY